MKTRHRIEAIKGETTACHFRIQHQRRHTDGEINTGKVPPFSVVPACFTFLLLHLSRVISLSCVSVCSNEGKVKR